MTNSIIYNYFRLENYILLFGVNTNKLLTIYLNIDKLTTCNMNDIYILKVISVIILCIAFILNIILLILKVDRNADYTYGLVSMPAIIAFLVIGISMTVSSGFNLLGGRIVRSLEMAALGIISIGSMWSYIRLYQKFDRVIYTSTLSAVLPFLISLSIGTVLIVFALLLHCMTGKDTFHLKRNNKS